MNNFRKWVLRNRSHAALVLLVAGALIGPVIVLSQEGQNAGTKYTVLYNFDAAPGYNPDAPLIQATDGNLYGTTINGCNVCGGTVFKITPSGTLTTVFNFGLNENADGSGLYGGLIQATNGNFYGTNDRYGTWGWGTFFELTSTGKATALYGFCPQENCTTDGLPPTAAVVQGTDGNFYGTTWGSGPDTDGCYDNGYYGCGIVFKITPSGTLTVLHSFDGTDGAQPDSGALVQATDGKFYGSTGNGGAYGYGTIFRITYGGSLTSLHSFNSTDGANPSCTLVQATDGNFYGTTQAGGANGEGTVFKITQSGTLTTLYSFCPRSGCADGSGPEALVQASDGNFYGITLAGGANDTGTVFKVTPGGTLTTLHNFDSTECCGFGEGLVQDTNGSFYGNTYAGGTYGDGTIFSLSVGLAPFVETKPTSGKVGTNVYILGTLLEGSTSVTFNGTPAAFTVESNSLIKTTVPAGATSGEVKVIKPGGAVSSNVPFKVIQ